jgi:hypothetical protein
MSFWFSFRTLGDNEASLLCRTSLRYPELTDLFFPTDDTNKAPDFDHLYVTKQWLANVSFLAWHAKEEKRGKYLTWLQDYKQWVQRKNCS